MIESDGRRPVADTDLMVRMALAAGTVVLLAAMGTAAPVDFGTEILPVLSDRCFACHGPDAAQRQAGLRLDVREAALAPVPSGTVAIRPGNAAASELFSRVSSADLARRMPPAYLGQDPLATEEIEALRSWIEDGAEYSAHWAFEPPRRKPSPAVSAPGWLRQGLDAFVLARLDSEGLRPARVATPAVWLRRMMFDLTGLPPSLEQVRAFEREARKVGESAYARAVDRALSSPRYGERMAVDWLDVARYADTHGFNNDSERSMWPWRDWVIGAFNRNLPQDEFLTQQIAGDLIPGATHEQRIATGFNRNHVINSEGGIIEEEYRVEYVADRVRTLGMAWLGLTFECARCHDHKFDPISQRDYYRLFAFFDSVPEHGEAGRVANAVPMVVAPTDRQKRQIEALRQQIGELERGRADRLADWRPPAGVTGAHDVREPPAKADFLAGCDDAPDAGVVGNSCRTAEYSPDPRLKLEDHGAFTLALWLLPEEAQPDAALFSAIDYSPAPASSEHGRGIELRIVRREAELRLSKRYPSYSITVRSVGADLAPGVWHHVAAVYEGSEGKSSMRARAGWVRLYVDGQEVETAILHDDAQGGAEFVPPFRLGHDNGPDGGQFAGRIDEVSIWRRAFSENEAMQSFGAGALAWAASRPGDARARLWMWRMLEPDKRLVAARRELFALQRGLPTSMVMQDMARPRQTHVLMRGRYDSPGEPVRPGVPEGLLGTWPEGAPPNRLGLARWLTSPSQPTVARVIVNRVWQQFFGTGLVKTSGDFGLQGEAPSHPALLAWLAVDFVESGWDLKRLVRSIALSATYRQDSAAGAEIRRRDPENRMLARGPRLRLPAESIRDQALELAGMLSTRIGGPSVRPYQPEGLYDGIVVGADYPGTKWKQDEGESLYRRGLYTFWKRTLPHPAMTVFDAPDREFCTVRRSITNTPLQALTLMNDPTFVEASRLFAERVLRTAGTRVAERLGRLFELGLGRLPEPEEAAVLTRALAEVRSGFDRSGADPARFLTVGATPADPSLDPVELASYSMVASMVLSSDEAITKP